MERYWDTTDDVYRDVIDVLDNENIERLKKYMLDILTNWKVEVDDSSPDLFNNYSEDDIFYLTPENVGDVIRWRINELSYGWGLFRWIEKWII